MELNEFRYGVDNPNNIASLAIDELLQIARDKHPDEHHFYIRLVNREGDAVPVWAVNQSYL